MRDFTACDRDAAEDGADRGGADRISSDTTASYEVRLRELLADTYGADMVDVLIYAGIAHRRIMDLAAQRPITGRVDHN